MVRQITSSKVYRHHMRKNQVVGETAVNTRENGILGPRTVLRVCVAGGMGRLGWQVKLVGRKWHRAFLVGSTGKAEGGNVLQSAAEAVYQE